MLNCSGAIPPNTSVVVCPTSIHLSYVQTHLRSDMITSAQNVNHILKLGAYTGEVSPKMLTDMSVGTVLVGHSERRHVYNESLDTIKAKVAVSLEEGLKVILCVGETLEQREAGNTMDVVGEQIETALAGVGAVSAATVIVAYEPVWAIGTGKTATPELAQEVHVQIRATTTMFLDDEAHCCQREFRSEKECCWLPPGCVTMFMFIVTVFGYGLGVMLSTILFWTIDFIQKE